MVFCTKFRQIPWFTCEILSTEKATFLLEPGLLLLVKATVSVCSSVNESWHCVNY